MAASSIAIIGQANSLFGAGLHAVLLGSMCFSKIFNARSYGEILSQLKESPTTRLLTVDFAMPGMKNANRLRQLRLQFPSLYLVVVSDSLHRDDIILAMSNGVHGYVPTSLPVDAIAEAFNTILTGKIFVPAEIAEVSAPQSDPTMVNGAGTLQAMSTRQRQVLELIAKGNSNKLIARALNLSEGTVKAHVSAGYRKIGVNNRASAAVALAQIHLDL